MKSTITIKYVTKDLRIQIIQKKKIKLLKDNKIYKLFLRVKNRNKKQAFNSF